MHFREFSLWLSLQANLGEKVSLNPILSWDNFSKVTKQSWLIYLFTVFTLNIQEYTGTSKVWTKTWPCNPKTLQNFSFWHLQAGPCSQFPTFVYHGYILVRGPFLTWVRGPFFVHVAWLSCTYYSLFQDCLGFFLYNIFIFFVFTTNL